MTEQGQFVDQQIREIDLLRRQRRKRVLVALLGLLVGLPGGAFQMWPGESLTLSAFHLGELFATNVYLAGGAPAGFPLTVHGALDFVPAALMQGFFGGRDHVYATILFHIVCVIVAQVLFLLLIERLLPAQRALLPLMFTGGLIASQTVHYRDLGLVATLFVFYSTLTCRPVRRQTFLIVLTGVVCYLGFLWSWNRGLPGLVAVTAALVILGAPRGERRFWFGPLAMVVTAFLAGQVTPLFRPGVIRENLALLLEASEGTRYAWEASTTQQFIGYSLLYSAALAALGLFALRRPLAPRNLAQGLLWGILLLSSIKIATDRLDWYHVMPSLWIMFAILVVTYPTVAALLPRPWLLASTGVMLAALWVTLGTSFVLLPMTALALASLLPIRPLSEWTIVWFTLVLMVLSFQQQMSRYALDRWSPREIAQQFETGPELTTGQEWLLDQVSGEPCLVDLTNRGLINELTGVPSCFRYGALLWVPDSRQGELIEEIKAASPRVIIWPQDPGVRTSFEGMRSLIDWINWKYPEQQCFEGECIRLSSLG